MTPLTMLFSRRCCGGPILVLSLAFIAFGGVFLALSAASLGGVFLIIGIATLTFCMLLGQSRCPRRSRPI